MEDYDVNVEMIWDGMDMDHALFYSHRALLGVLSFYGGWRSLLMVRMNGALP